MQSVNLKKFLMKEEAGSMEETIELKLLSFEVPAKIRVGIESGDVSRC